jgi:hypothetical protein
MQTQSLLNGGYVLALEQVEDQTAETREFRGAGFQPKSRKEVNFNSRPAVVQVFAAGSHRVRIRAGADFHFAFWPAKGEYANVRHFVKTEGT